jgi:hypothetical protein
MPASLPRSVKYTWDASTAMLSGKLEVVSWMGFPPVIGTFDTL